MGWNDQVIVNCVNAASSKGAGCLPMQKQAISIHRFEQCCDVRFQIREVLAKY
jgi:hypothetical protein